MARYMIDRGVRVSMRDSIDLVADVFLPDGPGPFTTLLQRTPYGRGVAFGTQTIVGMETLRALDAGFAVVVQDTRGRYDSAGSFTPFVNEADDGEDTVGWIREQSWSTGEVATYGASYNGATQWLLASRAPAGLIAMAPFLTTADFHHTWTYRNGALQLGFVFLWIIEALGPQDADHRDLPADHPVRKLLAEAAADPVAVMQTVPLADGALSTIASYAADWMANPTTANYWPEITPLADVATAPVPALHIVGLNDIFAEGSLHAYRTLAESNPATDGVGDQYLILGPWAHGNIGDWQGDEWLGYAASAAALDLAKIQLEFFRAAADRREPQLPRVQYFVSGRNEWREGTAWPPPTQQRVLYLAERGVLSEVVADDGHDRYSSDPIDPVPTVGGQTFLPGVLNGRNSGPKDQATIEGRDDVLVYRSDPLTAAATVTGHVHVDLRASSSATDCDWTARLVDVAPDGRALGIADGILRSRYRAGSEPTPLEPGRAETFRINIGTVAHEFAHGHRIGVQVASSNFPRFDRNPQTMVDPVQAGAEEMAVAEQTVFYGSVGSSLTLPIALQDCSTS